LLNKALIEAKWNDFIISAYASAAVSFLFFLTVGVITSLASARDPSAEAYESKVRYLFPSNSVPGGAISFASREIERLGCVAIEILRTIRVLESDSDSSYFKTYISTRYILKNIFDTRSLRVNVGPSITPDQDGAAEAQLGEMLEISVTPSGQDTERLVLEPEPIGMSGFERETWVEIEPGGSVDYFVRYWVRQIKKEDVFFSPKRYTEEFSTVVENETRSTLDIWFPGDHQRAVALEPHQSATILSKRQVYPGTFLRFWMCEAGQEPTWLERRAVV
jgi:hypothetical protein